MGISHSPDNNNYPVWGVDEGITPVMRYATMPTPALMKMQSLFGIPLRSSLTGQVVDDVVLQNYINQATSELEMLLDIYITPVKFYEKHDYVRDMFAFSFAYLRLNHPNVINVEAVQISFNNDTNMPAVITFPLEHVHVMPQEGVVQLVPAYGTSLSGFLMSAFSGVQYHAFQQALLQNWPGAVRVAYTCGFPDGKIPAIIAGLIERMAALKFLSALGPVIFPHTSTSVGIDGTSQSVGTLGPAYLRQRIQELGEQVQKEQDVAKGYFQRRILIDVL